MSLKLYSEIEKLKQGLLVIGSEVKSQLRKAVLAVDKKDAEAAKMVVWNDRAIDKMEVDLEEECLKVLALHQPVAGNLRLIIAILKINNDLERIGDLSAGIAKRAIALTDRENLPFPFDFHTMEQKVRQMLRLSLDALTDMNTDQAQDVCDMDDEIDDIYRGMYKLASNEMKRDPDNIDTIISMMGIARQLERVADLVTNIAEAVIYTSDGHIVRHGFGDDKATS